MSVDFQKMENSQVIAEVDRVFAAEIAALQSVQNSVRQSFPQAVELILEAKGKVVVTGIGKSGLIGRKIAATLASTGRTSTFINAADALHGDLGMVSRGDVVLMLSNSASTAELVMMLPSLKKMGVGIIGVFGRDDSELAKAVDVVLLAKITAEGCPLELAPMGSSTAALVVGDALASALMKESGFSADDFALFHPAGTIGRRLLLSVGDVMHPATEVSMVGLDDGFRELVGEMTRTNLGAVCVVDESKRLLGVISDGDVRRTIIQDDPFKLSARDIMTAEPVTVEAEMRLGDALALMESPSRRIYVVPVVQADGKVVGLVRMHDIVR